MALYCNIANRKTKSRVVKGIKKDHDILMDGKCGEILAINLQNFLVVTAGLYNIVVYE